MWKDAGTSRNPTTSSRSGGVKWTRKRRNPKSRSARTQPAPPRPPTRSPAPHSAQPHPAGCQAACLSTPRGLSEQPGAQARKMHRPFFNEWQPLLAGLLDFWGPFLARAYVPSPRIHRTMLETCRRWESPPDSGRLSAPPARHSGSRPSGEGSPESKDCAAAE